MNWFTFWIIIGAILAVALGGGILKVSLHINED